METKLVNGNFYTDIKINTMETMSAANRLCVAQKLAHRARKQIAGNREKHRKLKAPIGERERAGDSSRIE